METEVITDKPAEPAPIKTSSTGAMVPSNHKELITIIKQIAEGGGFPKRFETMPQRIAAYTLANALGGSRWQLILNNMANIQGQLIIYGEAPGAIAEQTGQVAEKKVYCIDKDYAEICPKNKNLLAEPFSGVCEIQRKGRDLKVFSYTMEQAMKAGQYPPMKPEWKNSQRTGLMIKNEDSPWEKFTSVMLMRKAQALALKFEFPDALIGTPIGEDIHNVAPDLVPVEDMRETNNSTADEINEPEVKDEGASL